MKKSLSTLFLIVLALVMTFTSCSIANKRVESLQILSGAPTEVEVGATPDFSEIKIKVTYNDGETKEVGYSDVTINPPDTSKVGKADYTISYDGGSISMTINVKAESSLSSATLESISYLSGIKTEFYEGADFHLTDLKVTAHYSDGSTKTIGSDKLTVVQNVDGDTAGEQTLIVEYEKKRCEINITVLKVEPTSFSLVLNGFATKVLIGKSLDTSAITGTLYYNNSTTVTVANTDIEFSAFDTSTVGEKKLVGTYQGMSAECNVEVLGVKSIVFLGFETAVKVNSTFDLSSLTAIVTATNNETFTIGKDEIDVDSSKFDTTLTTTNSKTAKISFGYCGSVKEYNIEVTAELEDAALTSLEYVSGVKTKIFVGETYDDSNIVATANRTYGYSSVGLITKADLTVSGTVNNTAAGTYPITYSLTEKGVTKSFTLNVEVKEPGPADLALSEDDLGWVIKGEQIDTSKITATLYYEYGTKTTPISNSELTFTGVDSSKAGKIEITVQHTASGLTETVTVTVVEIKSVTFNGVKDRYRLNNQIKTDDVSITILGIDDKTYTRRVDANTVIPTLTLDQDKKSQEKEYVFSYYGFEYKKEIEVYAEFEDTTLVSIEYSGSTRVFKGDNFLSKVSVLAYYTYGYTAQHTPDDGVTVSGDIKTGILGTYEITVTYMEKSASATVNVVLPNVTHIVINTAPYGIKDEAYDYNSVNVNVSFENNTNLTSNLSDFVDYGILAEVDVTSAGKKTLTLSANGKNYTKEITVYKISSIKINTDGFNNIVQLGFEFSTEGLGEILVYLEGRQEPAIRWTTNFTHNVNTAIMGTDYTLTATYLGVTSEPVKITVAEQNFVISGVEDPAGIAAWKNDVYSSKFLDSGYCYFVGDDNPFKYELNFQLIDINNNTPATKVLLYTGSSKVTLNGTEVGEEYVTIDEANHTFKFTSAAVGKTFTITTASAARPDLFKSLDVFVVDGYNVHDAIELNLLTNKNAELGEIGKYQLDVLYPFLANNQVAGINNMTYDEYVSFINGINGIIIHNNLTIQRTDLPDSYFLTTSGGEKYLWDHMTVFYRVFTEYNANLPSSTTPETFNIYGNYFTIVSNNIPIVAPQGTVGVVDGKEVATNNDDALSSSQLFAFDVSDDVRNRAGEENVFYSENYVLNVYALGLHDNDPSVAVQPELAQQRSKLGIIAMKFRRGTHNLNAVNIEAYFISLFGDYDDVEVNLDYCTLYNAWNNHIMTWSRNELDEDSEKFDGSLHTGYKPITIDITNSFVGKSGGPVIISVNKLPSEEFNTAAGSGARFSIDANTKIFAYVKGDESWFNSYGATSTMQTITSFNDLFKANGASFVTKVGSNDFVNLIYLNMDADFNPITFAGVTTDIDGSLSINGSPKIDMNDANGAQYGHMGVVDAIRQMAAAMGSSQMPPIFVTDMNGASYTDGVSGLQIAPVTGTAETDKYLATSGDYLAMYLYNLGILFGFNEEALPAEPTPDAFLASDETSWKIIDLHGIN